MSLISEFHEVKLAFSKIVIVILIPAFLFLVGHPGNLSPSLKSWDLNMVKGISIVSQHGWLATK